MNKFMQKWVVNKGLIEPFTLSENMKISEIANN